MNTYKNTTLTIFILLTTILTSSCSISFRHSKRTPDDITGSGYLQIDPPFFTPTSGKVTRGKTISISCPEVDAQIYYNIGDGTQADPLPGIDSLYSDSNKPVVTSNVVIKARAFKSGCLASDVVSYTYELSEEVIVGGTFTTYGNSYNKIVRINSDGTLDSSFNIGTGANNSVSSTVVQSDGKILIGGNFTSYNGTSRNYIARTNATGALDTSFDPGDGANDYVSAITIQDDRQILISGNFTSYNGVSRNYIARINVNGTLDTSFNPISGANNYVNTIAIQDDGQILIGGNFTTYDGVNRNHIARLNADGTLDTSFNPGDGVNDNIYSIAVQNDGKILIGGWFSSYNGVNRNYIARINTDGTLDTSFDTGTGTDYPIYSITVQIDEKILIGGNFTSYDGIDRNHITRINTDGTLDVSFDPGTGVDARVNSVATQTDGKILIGGSFSCYNGLGRNRIARLNTDETLDTYFDPGTGADALISSMAIQSNGKILIGGSFSSYNGVSRNYIARLNSDGTLDTSFDPEAGPDNYVYAIAVQSSGKILIGGAFTSYNGVTRNHIARLNANGTLDTTFNHDTEADGNIYSIVVQSDGNILIGGGFTLYNSIGRYHIARLTADGILDSSFDPGDGADNYVYSIAVQNDGKILIGGEFQYYNGISRNHITRINTDGTLDTSFNPGSGVDGTDIYSIAVQSNGKILIGGDFTSYDGVSRNYIARVNGNGTLDTSFDPGTGANQIINSIAILTDGKILIGGWFTSYNGTDRYYIAKLDTDGTLDASQYPGFDRAILSIVVVY